MNPSVVTRFAPSPTGNLNIGGVRAGIFAYLFARHQGGRFILRIEDTDRERSKKEYEENIIESLQWLGLEYDALYRQSDHTARYEELLHTLVEQNRAYVSKEEHTENGGRTEVVRFRNPNKVIRFDDLIHGTISVDTTELKDFVIAKSFTEPVFHFTNVVDDWDAGVTHVVRGDDHISNTPRQILIQEALDAPSMLYAHLPLILDGDRSKLSKRKGAKALTEYRDLGFIPEGILNFDAFLGWHPAHDVEILSKAELIEQFSLERVQKSPGIFNEEKLLWFNHEHLKKLSDTEFEIRLKTFSKQEFDARLVPLIKERAQTLAEATGLLAEYDFLDTASPDKNLLLQQSTLDAETTKTHLTALVGMLKKIESGNFTQSPVKEVVFPYATAQGRGAVLWPLRVALSGKENSPDPFTLAGLLGKEKTLARIEKARGLL
ncbi:MAG: glutamate--tRNA ligase family protein [bacterium]|nr:glutamate--tRNA ligase family protein [bacterium]